VLTPTDAQRREQVILTHRGWKGTLLFVDPYRPRAKVLLPSGDVVVVPLDQLVRADTPHALTQGRTDAASHSALG